MSAQKQAKRKIPSNMYTDAFRVAAQPLFDYLVANNMTHAHVGANGAKLYDKDGNDCCAIAR